MNYKKYLAVLMGTMMLAASTSSVVFAESETEEAVEIEAADNGEAAEQAQENKIMGEVTAVAEGTITVSVRDMSQDPGAENAEASEDENSGEETTITVTEDTVITKQSGMQGGPGNGQGGEAPSGEVPEKPEGESEGGQGGEAPSGEVPEKPEGESENGQGGEAPSGEGAGMGEAPDMNGGEAEEITLDDIQVGDMVEITLDEEGNALTITVQSFDMGGQGGQGGPGGMGGANTQTYDYSGELSGAVTADGEETSVDAEEVAATEVDQNAALAENGGSLIVTNSTLTKTGDDTNGDNCNFYGLNSIVLSSGEDSEIQISDSSLTADSEGSNAIFATDNGTVYAYNDTIETSAGNSRGLDATYSGTIVADSMNIHTQGEHSASIATDRGGGSISASNSEVATEGSGSPLLYSTGDIEVDSITGTATGSQIAGMEGLNTIMIEDSDLTSTITERTASDPIANGVIIYQSTSGDAETSTGESALFQAVNSTLTSSIASGSMFYMTNTDANVVLSDTVVNFDSENANLIQVEGNDSNNWGTAGSNGADVTFTALGEELSGNVSVDTISSLDLYLLDGTSYTGAMEITENAVNTDVKESPITVNLDSESVWTVTGDSTITNLNAEEGAQIVDADGNTVTILVNGETVVEGTSAYTITVTGSYTNEVSTDEDNEISTNYIDRTAFDDLYGTSTAFGDEA